MATGPRFIERRQVVGLMLVVVVGEADHYHLVDTGLAQHECLHSSGRSAIAVSEWVHCA